MIMRLFSLVCAIVAAGCGKPEVININVPEGFVGLINVYEDPSMKREDGIIVDVTGVGKMKNLSRLDKWNSFVVKRGNEIIPSGSLEEGSGLGFYLLGRSANTVAFFIGSKSARLKLEEGNPESFRLRPGAK